jgi:hypothetical protein
MQPKRPSKPEAAMTTRSQVLQRDQIVSNLATIRQHILAAISMLSETEADQVFLGAWSVRDLVAHLVGWDVTNLQAVQEIRKGELPAFYRYRDPDWQAYNARLVRNYKRDTLEELLAAVQTSQLQLLDVLQSIPPEDFVRDFRVRFRGYRVTIRRLLEAETKDEETHYQQIVDFFRLAP